MVLCRTQRVEDLIGAAQSQLRKGPDPERTELRIWHITFSYDRDDYDFLNGYNGADEHNIFRATSLRVLIAFLVQNPYGVHFMAMNLN